VSRCDAGHTGLLSAYCQSTFSSFTLRYEDDQVAKPHYLLDAAILCLGPLGEIFVFRRTLGQV